MIFRAFDNDMIGGDGLKAFKREKKLVKRGGFLFVKSFRKSFLAFLEAIGTALSLEQGLKRGL